MTDLTSPDGLLPSLGGWFHPLTALLVALDAPIPPVPSEVFVIGSGSLAAAGRVSLPLSVLTAWLGCWLGDVGLYVALLWRMRRRNERERRKMKNFSVVRPPCLFSFWTS